MKDLPDTDGHSFNDYNHCDLTTMLGEFASNENNGQVNGIDQSNQLGEYIGKATIQDLGPGGSWSTCMIGMYVYIIRIFICILCTYM